MKKTFLFLVFALSIGVNAQTAEPLKFQEIITADSVSADLLYKKMIEWSADNFKNPDAAINYSDADLKIIKGKTFFDVGATEIGNGLSARNYHGRITFDFKFECKEGKMRYTFENFEHASISYLNIGYCSYGLLFDSDTTSAICGSGLTKQPQSLQNKFYPKVIEATKNKISAVIASIESYVSTLTENKDDNW